MYEDAFFIRRKKNMDQLLRYGFTRGTDGCHYAAPVMNGQFLLHVFIGDSDAVSTRLIDCASGEEYALHKVATSTGAFVGEVRAACSAVLTDIASSCYEPDVFRAEQTLALIGYVRQAYGDEPEFLWDRFPDYAVWRRRDDQKWYGVIMTIPRKKLGLDSSEPVEILDLRIDPARMAETVDHERYFPGWHMNKKTWYTVILDGSVPTEEICRRIDESYHLKSSSSPKNT